MSQWSLAWGLARRFVLSRRNPGAVNAITWIASVGIALITASLVAVLSVFNGFTGLITDLYAAFDAELKCELQAGRYFSISDSSLASIRAVPGVKAAEPVLEGRAVLRHGELQRIVHIKAVPTNYLTVQRLDTVVRYGVFKLSGPDSLPPVVIGQSLGYELDIIIDDPADPLELYALRQHVDLRQADPEAIRAQPVVVSGVFSLQREYDASRVLLNLPVAQRLFGLSGQASAYEIKLTDGRPLQQVKQEVQAALGSTFTVRSVPEQHPTLYRVMRTEKWVGYGMLLLMLLLVCVNVVGTLTLMVVVKKRLLAVLGAIGVPDSVRQRVFVLAGIYLTGTAGIVGVLAGSLLVWSQETFAWLSFANPDYFVVSAFPVSLKLLDVFTVLSTVLVLGWLAAKWPARKAARMPLASTLREA